MTIDAPAATHTVAGSAPSNMRRVRPATAFMRRAGLSRHCLCYQQLLHLDKNRVGQGVITVCHAL